MTNAVPMGPPPSPKEPRRSGRRSVPSASKSPAGSPTSDVAPKPKENGHKSNPPPSSNGGRTKRAKQEELDDALDDIPKPPVGTNGRTKRKGKEKEKAALTVDVHVDELGQNGDENGKDGAGDAQEDEEQGITRCPCEGMVHSAPSAYASRSAVGAQSLEKKIPAKVQWSCAKTVMPGSMEPAWASKRRT